MLAIDLCAGSGWAVACAALGISELGIEIMPEAIATRNAMGAYTQDVSIADLPDSFCSQAPIQIAGPPCQTFSAAGKGEGRAQLDEVLRRIRVLHNTGELERGGSGDPRTWLVLEPLRLAIHGLPTFIVWEQVPPVLPVWEACAVVLRATGYSVWTGILNSEQYGVPQTRRRAFLIARRDGWGAMPPMPTHSRYHNRDPERLDAGVLPWVSMADALGWSDGVMGFPRADDQGGDGYRERDLFTVDRPSPAVVGKSRSWKRWEYVNGTGANAARRPADTPTPTVHFGARANGVSWEYVTSTMPNATRRSGDQPAPTIAFGNDANSAGWHHRRPATTVKGDPRIAPPGHHDRQMNGATRVTVAEAAALQTFPPDHPFRGSMTKQYLQIGNAVPPLLGKAILSTFLTETT